MPISLFPKDVIKKSYLKQKLTDKEFEAFKKHLTSFEEATNENESEEYNKNLITDFLNNIGYTNSYKINTSGRVDLAIYKNNIPEVLIESKSLKNKSEMIKHDSLNKKSFHEAILYYMREKIKHKNFNIRHVIITNNIEWFVFDATQINKIATNKRVERLYNDFEIDKTLFSQKTDEFYKHLGIILADDELLKNIKFARFYLKEKQTNTQLKHIYKLLSPTHLLKLYGHDDSNTLNKNFYYELLHIMGLEETTKGSKKIIGRKGTALQDDGSLLESTILKLKIEHDIHEEEKLFEIALELNITWLNRILFLKLLEARLLTIHNGKYPKFLSYEIVDDFDKLNTLFFEILARRIDERESIRIEAFKNIPYLNSSLFEITPLERQYLKISELKNNTVLKKYSKTILKTQNSELGSIEYLLKFLNAYDFGSNEKDEFKNEHSPLINSSVLGLIFEKINGYKDGSFFTPSFVTMYMTKESIRKTVLEKFNKTFSIEAKNFDELKNYCEANFYKDEFLTKANELINNITIVDPAVGSGHFLVSALNEILSIKSNLKILKSLNYIQITNENDELYIETQDGFFEYTQTKEGNFLKETQKIQELIFKEKLYIIENQLFGVDINVNSVKITQLRLWIELLKESYYDKNNELATLPNIDINIKAGNSLVSKYPLKDSDTKNQLLKEKLNDYKKYVKWYKETNDKAIKKEIVQKIEDIKQSFSQKLKDGSPQIEEFKKLIKGDKKTKGYIEQFGFKGLSEEIIISYAKQEHCILYARFGKDFNPNDTSLFGDAIKLTAKEKKSQKTKAEAMLKKINKKYAIIKEFENAEIFQNSFEWRFEFPEVLNENGEFFGFDIVIGNPPYIQLSKVKNTTNEYKKYLKEKFGTSAGRLNTFIFFIHLSTHLLKNKGNLSFIVPNTILSQDYYSNTRKMLTNNVTLTKLIEFEKMPFEDATVETTIIEYENIQKKEYLIEEGILTEAGYTKKKIFPISKIRNNHNFSFLVSASPIIEKVFAKKYTQLKLLCNINQGIALKGDKKLSIHYKNEENKFYKLLDGRNINPYSISWDGTYLDYNIDRIHSCKREDIFKENEKLLFRRVSSSLIFAYDNSQYYALNTLVVVTLKEKAIKDKINIKFILALMNSKLMNYIYVNKFKSKKKVFSEIQATSIGLLPFPNINEFTQNKFVKIVNKIIELKKQNKNTSKLERLIDKKVYALYNLDEKEIALIENNYTQ